MSKHTGHQPGLAFFASRITRSSCSYRGLLTLQIHAGTDQLRSIATMHRKPKQNKKKGQRKRKLLRLHNRETLGPLGRKGRSENELRARVTSDEHRHRSTVLYRCKTHSKDTIVFKLNACAEH